MPKGSDQSVALAALLEELRRDGWERTGVGKNWYNIRLRRLMPSKESKADLSVTPPVGVEAFEVAPVERLRKLTPSQFEEAVAALFTRLGFVDVNRVGRAGDLGVDVRCCDAFQRSVLVQCKRFALNVVVGSDDVQRFIGMITVEHKADRGVFVTTSSFTAPARKLAERHGIVLIDATILDWLLSTRTSQN